MSVVTRIPYFFPLFHFLLSLHKKYHQIVGTYLRKMKTKRKKMRNVQYEGQEKRKERGKWRKKEKENSVAVFIFSSFLVLLSFLFLEYIVLFFFSISFLFLSTYFFLCASASLRLLSVGEAWSVSCQNDDQRMWRPLLILSSSKLRTNLIRSFEFFCYFSFRWRSFE